MDESESQIALESAAALAEWHGAALDILGCIERPHDLDVIARVTGRDADRLFAEFRAEKRARMQARLSALLPGHSGNLRLRIGKTFVEIIEQVIETGCDLVVKRAEPLAGVGRFLFASTDQHLLRKCPCPVWLQTPKARKAPERILVAVDVDLADAAEPETLHALNRRLVETACTLAAPTRAQVVVVHAWQAIGDGMLWAFSSADSARATSETYVNEIIGARQRALETLVQEVAAGPAGGLGVRPDARLARGAPDRVIEEQCRALDPDLVVMGTVARTGLHGIIIGNTAENIINSIECPVLAVKPDGFVSPLAPTR
jgi:nucleotide-binding universal stress UspA family protein